MKDLLLRWARLEPEKCELGEDNDIEIQLVRESVHFEELDKIDDFDIACIQYGVQEAIVARNWEFLIEATRFMVTPGNYETRYETSVISYFENGPSIFYGVTDVAAESLLGSYLEALEAMQIEDDD